MRIIFVLQITFFKLTDSHLNKKQKAILLYLASNNEHLSITRIVPLIAAELLSSTSSIWANMRELRDFGFISYQSKSLTPIGTRVANHLRGEDHV